MVNKEQHSYTPDNYLLNFKSPPVNEQGMYEAAKPKTDFTYVKGR